MLILDPGPRILQAVPMARTILPRMRLSVLWPLDVKLEDRKSLYTGFCGCKELTTIVDNLL